jgi:hypothetical protein
MPAATGGSSKQPKKAAGAGAGAAKKAKAPAAPKAAKTKASASASTSSSSPAKGAAAAAVKKEEAKGKGGSGSGPRYFLMKSEPDTFSIQQLAGLPKQTSCWEGVRNYQVRVVGWWYWIGLACLLFRLSFTLFPLMQARNIMRDEMRVGDQAFFYHSSCKVRSIYL